VSSTLHPDESPQTIRETGHTTGVPGPSDSSYSGSDTAGAKRHDSDVNAELDNHALETGAQEEASDTDRTGERSSADGNANVMSDADIDPDRIERLTSKTRKVAAIRGRDARACDARS
jgi:hypothetical protein